MTIKKITPVGEKIIPMHDGNGNLPAEGKNLVLNSYWYRLEADKDVSFDDPDSDLPGPLLPGGEEHDAEQ